MPHAPARPPHRRLQISAEFEDYRDERWRREGTRVVSTVLEAEHFVEQVGFAACMTDSRRPGPSLYVAVCGRRDAVLPRNVQKDPESSLTWTLKDQLIRRGKVYYAKLARGKAMLIAPRMVPHFNAIRGMRRADETKRLSRNARAVLKVLRKEWEMATSDLRADSGVTDRVAFTRAIDELQAAMIVVPSEAVYLPKFTYLWTLGDGSDILAAVWGAVARVRDLVTIKSGGPLTLQGRGTVSLSSAVGAVSVDAKGALSLKAMGLASVTALGSVQINAAAAVGIRAATVPIMGLLTANGKPVI